MTITKDEAAQALSEATLAGGRMREAFGYAKSAPFLLIWGVVWLVADTCTQFAPRLWGVWPCAAALGFAACLAIGFGLPRGSAVAPILARGWRPLATWVVVSLFVASLFLVIPVTSWRESHSISALCFGFIYLGVGLWIGWRIAALGAALIALTLVGFYAVSGWYPLYMGVVGGGALILGGLWLRKL